MSGRFCGFSYGFRVSASDNAGRNLKQDLLRVSGTVVRHSSELASCLLVSFPQYEVCGTYFSWISNINDVVVLAKTILGLDLAPFGVLQ